MYLRTAEFGLGLPFELVAAVVVVELGIHWIVE